MIQGNRSRRGDGSATCSSYRFTCRLRQEPQPARDDFHGPNGNAVRSPRLGRRRAIGPQQAVVVSPIIALEHGVPSHGTFGRVFARLDTAEFLSAMRGWIDSIAASLRGQGVAIDGKTQRGSLIARLGKRPCIRSRRLPGFACGRWELGYGS